MKRKIKKKILLTIVFILLFLNIIFVNLFFSTYKTLYTFGYSLIGIGAFIYIFSAITLHRNKDKESLISNGVYNIIRHPLFLGVMIMFFSHIFLSQNWIIILNTIITIVCLYFICYLEEQENIEKFGKEYEEYIKKVPRFNFLLGIWRLIVKTNYNIEDEQKIISYNLKGKYGLIGLICVHLLPIYLSLLLGMLVSRIFHIKFTITSLLNFILFGISQWITFLIMWLLIRKCNLKLKDIGYRGKINILTILLAVLFSIAALWLLILSSIFFDIIGLYWTQDLEVFNMEDPINVLLIVFLLLITTVVCEDTFYRAYSITFLNSYIKNKWIAGLIACFVFALSFFLGWGLRGSILLFLYAVLSMVLFNWRKSIYPCLIMHILLNFVQYILFPLLNFSY